MPSELQLAKQFNVSRGTVKQAVMDLVYEGVLYRRQGKGTYTALKKVPRSFGHLPSFTDDIRKTGHGSKSRRLKLAYVTPSQKIQELFGISDKDKVIKYKRLVLMEDAPVVVVTSYLSPYMYPNLSESELGESLYETLNNKYHIVPVKARDTYTITKISPKTADLLQCVNTDYVCYSERIAFLEDDRPAEYVESFIRIDRFFLDIYIGMPYSEIPNQENSRIVLPYNLGYK
jgi:GntR family transcriptional regulator